MIFLPIVERELRVASRKRGTFWTRTAAAIVALVIASGFFAMTLVGAFPFNTAALGKGLFATLTWLSFAVALSAGLFFTADCLSEEKREGTLGFLFLTDLRGYDVVLGKLLVTSLRGSFALLAVLPILAVTLLMGGVTGAEFWRASLALANALFVSLAAGLFVSALSRDSQRAMGTTLVLIALLAAVGPVIDEILPGPRPVVALTSPVFLFTQAGAWGRTAFWPALVTNQIVAWSLLLLSCVLLPRMWQEKARGTSATGSSGPPRFEFAVERPSAGLRAKLLNVNPVLWLASRARWQAAVLWAMAIVSMGLLVAFLLVDEAGLWFAWTYFGGVLALIIYLALASQAGRFFVEAQRSGLTELLLATPLSEREIVRGHWRGLLRIFGVPLLLCVLLQTAGDVWAQKHTLQQVAAAVAAMPAPMGATNAIATTNAMVTVNVSVSPAGTAVSGGGVPGGDVPWLGAIIAGHVLANLLTMGGNLIAICWFGSWMGMTSRNTSLATLKTIAFVQIIPWLVVSFVSVMAVPLMFMSKFMAGGGTARSSFILWYPLLTTAIATVLYLAKNIAFTIWARRKLHSDFRARATRTALPPIHMVVAPPAIAPPAIDLPTAGGR